MAHTAPGRHRAPGRFNPLSELTLLARESAQPVAKGVAIVAASGGLVASFAAPSVAADDSGTVVAAGTSVSGSALAGPVSRTATSTPALSAFGFVAPTARAAKPLVIEDILVKTQRAKAKADALAKAAAKARAQAAEKAAAEKAAAERRSAASRSSRSTTRTAVSSRSSQSSSSRSSSSTKSPSKSNPAPAPRPAPAPSSSGIAGIAQSLYGVPYVYGGTSTSGFDCSGYTQYVYRRAGISIPRTASAQQNAATRVSSPRPGDLVFFGTPAYHVGIYLGGGRLADEQRPGTVSGNHSIWTTPSGYGRF